jgi:hypothetical protein
MEKYIAWAKANKGIAMFIAFVCVVVVSEIIKNV